MTDAISITGIHDQYKPYDTLRGSAQWSVDNLSPNIAINLYWYTEGRGDQDLQVVESRHFSAQSTLGSSTFEFVLPQGPLSFSGKLISLRWAVEALVGDARAVTSFVVTPYSSEVMLTEV